jgi:hypothetical protein
MIVTFVTKVINIPCLLCLRESAQSVPFCGHFLSCFEVNAEFIMMGKSALCPLNLTLLPTIEEILNK